MTKRILLLAIVALWQVCAFTQSVAPQKLTAARYGFTFGNAAVEIDTAKGARIMSLKVDGNQVLYLGSTSDMNGSTFWPSPQSFWNWPPISEIDNKAYSVKVLGNKLKMTGKTNTTHKLSVTKIFEADNRDTSFTITYILINQNTTTRKVAPWEITRVKAEGLTFFGKGTTSVTGNMASNTFVANDVVWYNQDSTTVPSGTAKFFCDGQGWLAHANKDNYLFLKKFENIEATSAANYGTKDAEAEVEVYTSPDQSYTELENQGAFVSVAGGDSLKWKVKWYIRKIESADDIFTGSKKLVDLATRLVALPDLPDTFPVTGIIRIAGSSDFSMYPVPANDNITLILPVSIKNAFVSIYNVNGSLVLTGKINAINNKLSLKSVTPGTYVCKVSDNKGFTANKVLLVK